MSRRPWFEDCYLEDRSNLFMPLDIESPINHPTLMADAKEEQTAGCGGQRDTVLGLKDNRTQEG